MSSKVIPMERKEVGEMRRDNQDIRVEITVEGACCSKPNVRPEHCDNFSPSSATVFDGPIKELMKIPLEKLIDDTGYLINVVEGEYEDYDGTHYCWSSWVEIVVRNENGKELEGFRITLFNEENWTEKFEEAIRKIITKYGGEQN